MSSRTAAIIASTLAIGVAVGIIKPLHYNIDILIKFLLYILVFVAGLTIGRDLSRGELRVSKAIVARGVGYGILVMAGGALAGLATYEIIGGSCMGCFLIGGIASGWYTLAGPLVSQTNPLLGLSVFIANMARESFHMIFYPVLARILGRPAVSIGGATTMDTGLPVVILFGDSEDYMIAVLQGITITLGAPIIAQLL